MRSHNWFDSRRTLAAIGLMLLFAAGCGYPVAEPMNMEVISSLRTALSARNEDWLKANETIVEERHHSGAMRDDEYQAFINIIRRAQQGEWKEAEQEVLAFQRAQRPTAEQIEKVREFHNK